MGQQHISASPGYLLTLMAALTHIYQHEAHAEFAWDNFRKIKSHTDTRSLHTGLTVWSNCFLL